MKNQKKTKKAILAFSGGLDTSFCALYLAKKGYEVVTLTVDTGGFTQKEIEQISKQSKLVGATKHYFIDGKIELYKKLQGEDKNALRELLQKQKDYLQKNSGNWQSTNFSRGRALKLLQEAEL